MNPTSAVEQTIALNLLIEWENNPRKTRKEEDVVQMAASTATVGQQAPLIVFKAPGETLYKVIEGETRRRAYNLNATNGICGPDAEIRCWVVPEESDETTLRAIAVAANTVRTQMNAIEEMEAFHDLAMSGLKIGAIAEMFAYNVHTVRQRLALGELIPAARDLVREGKRQIGWAQAMTLGTVAAQERIVNAIVSDPSAYIDGAAVKADLTRGNIPVSSALFDPKELSSSLVCDLFNPEGDYFTDVTAFWERQNKEIQKKLDELQTTHANVKYVDRTRFDDSGWTQGGVEAESTAVIISYDDGSIEIRTGLIPPAYEEADDGEGNFLAESDDFYANELDTPLGADDTTDAPVASPPAGSGTNSFAPAVVAKVEINPLDNATKDTTSYLTAQVTAALKLYVASNPRMGMAFVIASTLTRRGPASTMQITGLSLDQREQTSQVFAQLQAKRAARDRIVTEADIHGITSPAEVITRLVNLEDGLLEQLFAYTVADSIAVGLDEGTADIFEAVGLDLLAGWQIEENYLKTLNNAQIRALATEIIAPENQPSPRAQRSLVEAAILESVNADDLNGNFLGDQANWLPPQVASLLTTNANDDDSDQVAQAA